jgi:hypothetical protein
MQATLMLDDVMTAITTISRLASEHLSKRRMTDARRAARLARFDAAAVAEAAKAIGVDVNDVADLSDLAWRLADRCDRTTTSHVVERALLALDVIDRAIADNAVEHFFSRR